MKGPPTPTNGDADMDSTPPNMDSPPTMERIICAAMDKLDKDIVMMDRVIRKVTTKLNNQEDEEEKIKKVQVIPRMTEVSENVSLIQKIYAENKARARQTKMSMIHLGCPLLQPYLPSVALYKQPSDLPQYHENIRKWKEGTFKKALVQYLWKKKQETGQKEKDLAEDYKTKHVIWQEKLKILQENPKRQKDLQQCRKYFEQIFPNIKRKLDQEERFNRARSCGNAVRSDAELAEIVEHLTEHQECEDKQLESVAPIPPMTLNPIEKSRCFYNECGRTYTPHLEHKANMQIVNQIWTEEEKRTFREKFGQYGKVFYKIIPHLPNKNIAQCIQYYYLSKKKENYKALLPKKRKKQIQAPKENMQPVSQQQPPILSPATPRITRSKRVEQEGGAEAGNKWLESEIDILKECLQKYGKNWTKLSKEVLTKSTAQCKHYYQNHRKRLNLDNLLKQSTSDSIKGNTGNESDSDEFDFEVDMSTPVQNGALDLDILKSPLPDPTDPAVILNTLSKEFDLLESKELCTMTKVHSIATSLASSSSCAPLPPLEPHCEIAPRPTTPDVIAMVTSMSEECAPPPPPPLHNPAANPPVFSHRNLPQMPQIGAARLKDPATPPSMKRYPAQSPEEVPDDTKAMPVKADKSQEVNDKEKSSDKDVTKDKLDKSKVTFANLPRLTAKTATLKSEDDDSEEGHILENNGVIDVKSKRRYVLRQARSVVKGYELFNGEHLSKLEEADTRESDVKEGDLKEAGEKDTVLKDAGLTDTGVKDAGLNTGLKDAGMNDTGMKDIDVKDIGLKDSCPKDAGLKDTGVKEAGLKDAGLKDAGLKDAGLKDAGAKDAAVKDTAVKDAAVKDTTVKDVAVKDSDAKDENMKAVAHFISGLEPISSDEDMHKDKLNLKIIVNRSNNKGYTIFTADTTTEHAEAKTKFKGNSELKGGVLSSKEECLQLNSKETNDICPEGFEVNKEEPREEEIKRKDIRKRHDSQVKEKVPISRKKVNEKGSVDKKASALKVYDFDSSEDEPVAPKTEKPMKRPGGRPPPLGSHPLPPLGGPIAAHIKTTAAAAAAAVEQSKTDPGAEQGGGSETDDADETEELRKVKSRPASSSSSSCDLPCYYDMSEEATALQNKMREDKAALKKAAILKHQIEHPAKCLSKDVAMTKEQEHPTTHGNISIQLQHHHNLKPESIRLLQQQQQQAVQQQTQQAVQQQTQQQTQQSNVHQTQHQIPRNVMRLKVSSPKSSHQSTTASGMPVIPITSEMKPLVQNKSKTKGHGQEVLRRDANTGKYVQICTFDPNKHNIQHAPVRSVFRDSSTTRAHNSPGQMQPRIVQGDSNRNPGSAFSKFSAKNSEGGFKSLISPSDSNFKSLISPSEGPIDKRLTETRLAGLAEARSLDNARLNEAVRSIAESRSIVEARLVESRLAESRSHGEARALELTRQMHAQGTQKQFQQILQQQQLQNLAGLSELTLSPEILMRSGLIQHLQQQARQQSPHFQSGEQEARQLEVARQLEAIRKNAQQSLLAQAQEQLSTNQNVYVPRYYVPPGPLTEMIPIPQSMYSQRGETGGDSDSKK